MLLSTMSLAPSAAAAVDSPDPAETKSSLDVFADFAVVENIDLGWWWASLVLVLLADIIRSWRDSGCFAARAGWSGGRRLACSGGRR